MIKPNFTSQEIYENAEKKFILDLRNRYESTVEKILLKILELEKEIEKMENTLKGKKEEMKNFESQIEKIKAGEMGIIEKLVTKDFLPKN